MKVQVTTIPSTGNSKLVVTDKLEGQPVKMHLTAGSGVEVAVDGVKQTGKQSLGKKSLQLKKEGNDLVIETLDGENQVELIDFYQTPDVVLYGEGWTYTSDEHLMAVSEGVAMAGRDDAGALLPVAFAGSGWWVLGGGLVLAALGSGDHSANAAVVVRGKPSVNIPEAAGGINAAEVVDGVAVVVTLPSGAGVGDVITVGIDGGTPVTHTVTQAEVTAGNAVVTLPATALAAAGQGAAVITTTYTDSAGHPATNTPITTTVVIDTIAPGAPIVTVPEAIGGIGGLDVVDGITVVVTLPPGAGVGDIITVRLGGGIPVTHVVTPAEIDPVSNPSGQVVLTLPPSAIDPIGQGPAVIITTYIDPTGNPAPNTPILTPVVIDTIAPGAPTVTVPEAVGGISGLEVIDGIGVVVTLPPGAGVGDVITVSIDGGVPVTHVVTAAEVDPVSNPSGEVVVVLPAGQVTATGEGPATITTTYKDGAGNIAANTPIETQVVIDTVPPHAPTVRVPEALGGITVAEAADGVPVLVHLPVDAAVGDVITISMDGGTPVTYTVTAMDLNPTINPEREVSVTLPSAAIAAAGQGSAVITTSYADAAGNLAPPVVTTVTIDTVAPGTPTVVVPENVGGITAAEALDGVAVVVTLPAGAAAGDVITVSVDGSMPVVHTVTAAEVDPVANPTGQVTLTLPAGDITAAGQGQANVVTTYVDASGNPGANTPITTPVTIDLTQTFDGLSVSVPEAAGGINALEASDGVLVVVTLPNGAAVGDVVTVHIDGATPVNYTVTANDINPSINPTGTVNVILSAADVAAAGQGPAVITTSYDILMRIDETGYLIETPVTIDTLVPAAPLVSIPEALGGIDAAEAADGVVVEVTVPAGAALGDIITVSIDGSAPVIHTVGVADLSPTLNPGGVIKLTLPTPDVTRAGQGPAVVTTTYTDASGNAAAPVATPVTIDTLAPGTPIVTVPEAAGGINAQEASDGVPVLVNLPAGAALNDVITVSIDGSTPVSHTVVAADLLAGSVTMLLPVTDVTAAGQGPAVITTLYADERGNAAAGTPVLTPVAIDTIAPADPLVSVPEAAGAINAAEAVDGVGVLVTLPPGAAVGDIITVSIDGGVPVMYTVKASDLDPTLNVSKTVLVTLPATAVTAAGQGPAVVSTVYTDAAGNPSPHSPVTTAVVIDTVAPSAPTVSVPEALGGLTLTEAANGVPVLVSLPVDAAVGDVITVRIGSSVPISHVVVAADLVAGVVSVTLPTADVTAAGAGTVSVVTTYQDAAGNAAPTITTPVVIDTTGVAGSPSVTVPEAVGGINALEASDGVVVLVGLPTGAAVGDIVQVSIDGSTPISHVVSASDITAARVSMVLPAADVALAGQGAANIVTTYSNAMGVAFPGSPITNAVTVDTIAPTALSVSVPEAVNGINVAEASDGVAVLVRLPSNAVAGDAIEVSIDGSVPARYVLTPADVNPATNPSGTVSLNLPVTDIAAAGQGAAVVLTTYMDASGNPATGSPVSTPVVIDTVAPTGSPSVNIPEAVGGITAAEAADGVVVVVTLPAGAGVGDLITVGIDGSLPVTHVVTLAEVTAGGANVTLPPSAIAQAGQGPAVITTTYTDPSGNPAPNTPLTTPVVIDTIAPGTPLVDIPEALGGINAAEAANGVPVLVTLPVDAKVGDVITVSVDGGTPVMYRVTASDMNPVINPDGVVTITLPIGAIAAAGQGPAVITTTYTDAAGNPAANTPIAISVEIDTLPPTAPTVTVPEALGGINALEAADGVTVQVVLPTNAKVGDVITSSLDGSVPVQYIVTAGDMLAGVAHLVIPYVDVVAAGQGSANIVTTYRDALGNPAANMPVTIPVVIDLVLPDPISVSVPEAAGGISAGEAISFAGTPVIVALPGNAAVNDVITVSIDGSVPMTHVVTAADIATQTVTFVLSTATLTTAGQGAAVITTTYTDEVGNVAVGSPILTPVNIDTVISGTPLVNIPEAAGGVNAAEAADGLTVLVTLPTGAAVGDVVAVVFNNSLCTPVTYVLTESDVDPLINPSQVISLTIPATEIAIVRLNSSPVVITTYQDGTGNPASNSPIRTSVVLSLVSPTAPTVDVPENALGGSITAAEAVDGVQVKVTLPLDGSLYQDDSIVMSIDGSTPIVHTITSAEEAAGFLWITLSPADIAAAGQGAAVITTRGLTFYGILSSDVLTNVVIDTAISGAPLVTVPEAVDGINALEASDGVVVVVQLPTAAAAGDIITVSIDGSAPVLHTVTAAELLAGFANVTLPVADVAAAGQGPATIITTYTDASLTAFIGTPMTTLVNIDTVGPSAASVRVPEALNGINALEVSDGIPVFVKLPSDAVAGDIISITMDGGTPVSYVVQASDLSPIENPNREVVVVIPAVAVTAAGQGPADIVTSYTDASGNPAASTPITTPVVIDTVLPGNPSVLIPEAVDGINFAEAADGVLVQVTLPGNAVAGDYIAVSIDGSTPVRHLVTAAEVIAGVAEVTLPNIDITNAGLGDAVVKTVYTDASSNVSANSPIFTTVTMTSSGRGTPTVSVPESVDGINALEAADGVPVLVTLPVGGSIGDLVTVRIDGFGAITHTVTQADVNDRVFTLLLTPAAVAAAGEGPAVVTTSYTDSSGVAFPHTPVSTLVTIDTAAPNAISVSVPDAIGGINAIEAADGVTVLVALPLNAAPGDVIEVSIDGSTPVSHIVTADDLNSALNASRMIGVTLPSTDVFDAGEGAANIVTTYRDQSGNPGSNSPVTTAVNIDTVAPTSVGVSVPEAVGGINAAEAADGVTVLVSLPANAMAGDVISVSMDGSTPVLHTVTATEVNPLLNPSGEVSLLLPPGAVVDAGQGDALITTIYSDASGNPAVNSPITTAVAIDSAGPSAAAVSMPEAVGGINTAEAADGVPVIVTLPTDAQLGDVITVSIDGSVPVSYVVTPNDLNVFINPSKTVSITLPAADVANAGQGAANVVTTYHDLNGNAASNSPLTTLVMIDTTAPGTPTVAVPEAAGGINQAEALDGVVVEVGLPIGAGLGDTITVNIDGSPPVSHVVTATDLLATKVNLTLPAGDITAAGQGPANIVTTYIDASGNAALNTPITTPVTIDTLPAPGTVSVNVPEASGGINLAEAADGVLVIVNLPTGAALNDIVMVSIDGSTPISRRVTQADLTAGTVSVVLPAGDVDMAGQGPASIVTTYANDYGVAFPGSPVITPVTIDTATPGTPIVDVPAAAGGINAAEAASGVDVVVTLPSGAALGDAITVQIDGSAPVTHIVSAADLDPTINPLGKVIITLPAADVALAGQGLADIVTTYTDGMGNPAASSPITTTVVIDTLSPGDPIVLIPEAANGINALEASDGVPVVVTLPSDARLGDVITVSIDGSVPLSHIVNAADLLAGTASVTLLASDLTSAGQGAANVVTTYADATGNASLHSPITTLVQIDTVAPVAGTLSFANLMDTGSSATDGRTGDSTYDLSLLGQEVGSTLNYQSSIDHGLTWLNTTAAQVNVSPEHYLYRAEVSDASGNTAVSNVIDVTVLGGPSVQSVNFVSATKDGVGGGIRAIDTGDVVVYSVTFDQVVTVDAAGTAMTLDLYSSGKGIPVISSMVDDARDPLDFARGERTAHYQGGSGTNTLTFTYDVTNQDFDHNGLSVHANALHLNGATITGAETELVATMATLSNTIAADDSRVRINTIDLGADGLLLWGHEFGGGWFYQLDKTGNGVCELLGPTLDSVHFNELKYRFVENAMGQTETIATQSGRSVGVMDEVYRYATINDVRVAVPTIGFVVDPRINPTKVYQKAGDGEVLYVQSSIADNLYAADTLAGIWDATSISHDETGQQGQQRDELGHEIYNNVVGWADYLTTSASEYAFIPEHDIYATFHSFGEITKSRDQQLAIFQVF